MHSELTQLVPFTQYSLSIENSSCLFWLILFVVSYCVLSNRYFFVDFEELFTIDTQIGLETLRLSCLPPSLYLSGRANSWCPSFHGNSPPLQSLLPSIRPFLWDLYVSLSGMTTVLKHTLIRSYICCIYLDISLFIYFKAFVELNQLKIYH